MCSTLLEHSQTFYKHATFNSRHKESQSGYLLLFLSCLLQASFNATFSCTFSLTTHSCKCYHIKASFCNKSNAFVNISNCPINILYRYTRHYLSILCHLKARWCRCHRNGHTCRQVRRTQVKSWKCKRHVFPLPHSVTFTTLT